MASTLTFLARVAASTHAPEFVPVVDGIPLTERIHAFETEHGMEMRSEPYAGLVPANYRCAPADEHYFGRPAHGGDGAKTQLLGCSCGEWGCWPLLARVVVEPDVVRWLDFEQPWRPERDYSGFGPFVFDRGDYASAVAGLGESWDPGG